MYLIVGLGNPGTEYEETRHNIGKNIVLRLIEEFNSKLQDKNNYQFSSIKYNDSDITTLIPLAYVNDSGRAVKQALSDFPDNQLIVVYDDLDIPFGEIRIRKSGSSGGHNGLESIINSTGTNKFWRLKIGIGRPPARKNPADFVLEVFKKQEQKELPFIIENSKDALIDIIENGPEWAMNKHH